MSLQHPLTNKPAPLPRIWQHYRDKKENRLFLSVDINLTHIILLEVKDYAPDEQRLFNPIEIAKFETMLQKGTRLQPYTPKV